MGIGKLESGGTGRPPDLIVARVASCSCTRVFSSSTRFPCFFVFATFQAEPDNQSFAVSGFLRLRTRCFVYYSAIRLGVLQRRCACTCSLSQRSAVLKFSDSVLSLGTRRAWRHRLASVRKTRLSASSCALFKLPARRFIVRAVFACSLPA